MDRAYLPWCDGIDITKPLEPAAAGNPHRDNRAFWCSADRRHVGSHTLNWRSRNGFRICQRPFRWKHQQCIDMPQVGKLVAQLSRSSLFRVLGICLLLAQTESLQRQLSVPDFNSDTGCRQVISKASGRPSLPDEFAGSGTTC